MTQALAIPIVIPNDWKRLDLIVNKIKLHLGSASSPTFTGITVTGLTASTLIGADADKALESVTIGTGLDYTRPTLSLSHLGIEDLADPGADKILFWDDTASACKWLGMGNSVAITDVTLDTIQDIRTSASPQFTGLTLSGLTQGSVVFAGASGVISQDNSNLFWDATNNRLGIGINSGFFPAAGMTVSGEMDLIHAAGEPDDHAFEIDVDAAGYGDVKAVDIDYITGDITKGEDEAVILINIDEIGATGAADVFGLEVLATEGDAGIYGMKVGVVVGPIHQDSGTFENPTVATNDTPATNVPYMIDGLIANVTPIFSSVPNDDDYILIGDIAVFEEIEFIITTGSSGAGIKPKFEYSRAGSNLFTEFFPVDGTNGFRNTGVVAWDADDLTNHGLNTDTTPDTYCIKITRQRTNLTTTPILGFAKVAATTEYIWDSGGNVNIKTLTISTIAAEDADVDKFLVDSSGVVKYRTGTQVLSDIGGQTQGDVLDDLNVTGVNTFTGDPVNDFLVGTAAGTLAWQYGATARTSMGVGTGDSPQFTGIELGHASDTTITRVSAGVIAVEGVTVMMVGGAPTAHLHNTDTLECDGIDSDGGAFPFDTTGVVTFNSGVTLDTGADLNIAGHIIFNTLNSYIGFVTPRLTFDNTGAAEQIVVTGKLILPDSGYLGSASVTTALQIDSSGNIALTGNLNLNSSIGELTCGSINKTANTLTLEIAGTPVISILSTHVNIDGTLYVKSGSVNTGVDGSVAGQWVCYGAASGTYGGRSYFYTNNDADDAIEFFHVRVENDDLHIGDDANGNKISLIGPTSYVKLADGAVMATSGAPTTDAMIANKKYVDDIHGGAPAAHTIVSHSDTTGTGAELNTLTSGGDVGALHTHAAAYQPLDAVLTALAVLTAVADNEFIVGTGAGTYAHENAATAKTSIGLGNVENTQLSTWAGSANITTLGTIATVGNITIADGGTIGNGVQLNFDDTNDYFEITGCNVGVNETAPLSKLQVTGSVGFDLTSANSGQDLLYLRDQSNGSGIGTFCASIGFSSGYTDTLRRAAIVSVQTGADADQIGLAFFTHPSASNVDMAEAVRINHDKKVGFGTPTPVTQITVEGAITLKEQAAADGDTAAYGQIYVKNDDPNTLMYRDGDGNEFTVDVTAV